MQEDPVAPMKLVIFGLTLSSSWGNGHATLWRGLIRALARRNHDVVFFERDVPYYAEHRDLEQLPGASLVLYPEWPRVESRARTEARQADACIVTSYCPDARAAAALVREDAPHALCVFYDLDTPVTLARLEAGETVAYLPERGLRDFDLVLSYTGGEALAALRERLGARRVAALYGHVDPQAHRPAPPDERFSADLSYLGTYAPGRQPALETLFVEPARRRPGRRFVLGGSGYPPDFPWAGNIWFVRHVAPPEHPPFYSSSRLTLNVTRQEMAAMGFCPSGRLFEAAACATPVLSDAWEGIEQFFTPGEEILLAGSAEEATAALDMPPEELMRIGRAARQRALDEHTSDRRTARMLSLLEAAASGGA
jgi:spore maturation protein CgeB